MPFNVTASQEKHLLYICQITCLYFSIHISNENNYTIIYHWKALMCLQLKTQANMDLDLMFLVGAFWF